MEEPAGGPYRQRGGGLVEPGVTEAEDGVPAYTVLHSHCLRTRMEHLEINISTSGPAVVEPDPGPVTGS